MKDMIVCPLKEDEKKRFFEFAKSLPDRDFWGKKGSLLRGDFGRFQKIFEYIKPFQPKCFLVAEEDDKFLGFVVAVYNPEWVNELRERYGHDVGKRAYILGIGVIQRRKDVLNRLTNELTDYFSKKEVESVEYPSLGNVCLTTASDVLIAKNLDALIMFREAGFKISECYYSMKLDLSTYRCEKTHPTEKGTFRLKKRSVEIFHDNEVLGRITWDPVQKEKTSINVFVARAHRGKGFGTILMAKVLDRLKKEGVRVLELGVDGNNLPALKLYRKFGFEVYETHFYISVPC